MRSNVGYGLILLIVVTFGCRKSTDMEVHVINPALDMDVPGATVVLVERKGSGSAGIFGGSAECKEIASAVTDEHGHCIFSREKLKDRKQAVYFLSLKKSWGVERGYTCSGRTSGFVEKGASGTYTVSDEAEGALQVVYHNLLNPSQPGDTMFVSLTTIEYPNPRGGVVRGDGGIFVDFPRHEENNPPTYASIWALPKQTIKAQRLRRYLRKRKMGVVTVQIDTIKVLPSTTTPIDIYW